MSRLTNKARGLMNAQKLREYVLNTPISSIPRNQYGSASQKKILQTLGIPTSNRDSTPIKIIFEKLNKKLGAEAIVSSSGSSEEIRSLKRTISTLQDRIAALKAENELLKGQQKSEGWFLETGRMVRS